MSRINTIIITYASGIIFIDCIKSKKTIHFYPSITSGFRLKFVSNDSVCVIIPPKRQNDWATSMCNKLNPFYQCIHSFFSTFHFFLRRIVIEINHSNYI